MRRPLPISVAATAIVLLSACGSATSTETAATAPIVTPASTDIEPTDTEPAASADTEPTDPEPTDTEPADTEPTATDAPAVTAAPSATDAPAATPPPDDGCSADNSPTATDVAHGPVPTLAVRPESASNALPDLAVRRINCGGGWVNLKNEIPADKPLLIWFWAPH